MSEVYLITQSLLSAYAYQFKCREEQLEDARESFLSTLRREKTEPTDAMQNCLNFEKSVYALAGGNIRFLEVSPDCIKWESGIRQVADVISGAAVQVKLKREIEVGGMRFLVYGILDAIKAGVIFDVKFKNNSFNNDKVHVYGDYVDSPQHPAYFYLCPEAYEFQYLVSDGECLYIETYRPDESPLIDEIIGDFIRGITASGDLELYKEKWLAL